MYLFLVLKICSLHHAIHAFLQIQKGFLTVGRLFQNLSDALDLMQTVELITRDYSVKQITT